MAELEKLDLGKIVPSFKIGTVETVATTAEAEVTNSGEGVDVVLDIKIPKGPAGEQGEDGEKGDTGSTYKPTVDTSGNLSWELTDDPEDISASVNIKGPQGDKGDSFHIAKVYDSVADMVADINNEDLVEGDIVLISVPLLKDGQKQYDSNNTLITDPDDPENARLYVKTASDDDGYEWGFLTDMSGASGIQGPQGDVLVPSYNEETGVLSWEKKTATDTVTVPSPMNIKGKDGKDGEDGEQGMAGLTPYLSIDNTPESPTYGHLFVIYDDEKQPALYSVSTPEGTKGGRVVVSE